MTLYCHRVFMCIVAASVVVLMILFGVLDVDVTKKTSLLGAHCVRTTTGRSTINGWVIGRESSLTAISQKFEEPKKHRIIIIGAGPTALGAAQRLHDLRQEDNNTVITILEELGKPGGLASSERDDQGFLWDVGVHVIFSHNTYFDRILNMAVPEWNYQREAAFVFMKGSDGIRRFIPYPVQNNIHTMDKGNRWKCLAGLREVTKKTSINVPANFDEWLIKYVGVGLADVFMRKYNSKFWTVDTTEMNPTWAGEHANVPSILEIKAKIKGVKKGIPIKVAGEGLNRLFLFPKYNGTSGMLEPVARLLPSHWFKFHEKVTGIDIDKNMITVEKGKEVKSHYSLEYDILISTVPLDIFIRYLHSKDTSLLRMQELVPRLVYTHTHIVGLGLFGQPPKSLADKSWVYFPDSDSPFYRVTMFSSFSDDHVPKAGAYWSLMCEIAQPKESRDPMRWDKNTLIDVTIQALVSYGFITAEMVVSKYYRRLDHGYPVPSLKRDTILDTVQPWLESKDIYSRGPFGGWKYEAGNLDHSFIQGVEVVDKIVRGLPEKTYPHPHFNFKQTKHRSMPLDYELVISHYNENLDWLKPYADHAHVYHKGKDTSAPFKLYAWERLPNVGRESHTYLHHIITNYDQLSNVTIFMQGNVQNHKPCMPENPLGFISLAKRGIPCKTVPKLLWTSWGRISLRHDFQTDPQYANLKIARVTCGEFYEDLMGSTPPVGGMHFCRNGCFAATKKMIQKHPLEFYTKAISYVNSHLNPEEGHYFERLWYVMFKT